MVEKIGQQYQIVSIAPINVESAARDFLETVGDAELFSVLSRDLRTPAQSSAVTRAPGAAIATETPYIP